MSLYQFLNSESTAVLNTETRRCIYIDQPSTIHYEDYLKWLSEGNSADPYVAPPAPAQPSPEQAEAHRQAALWQAAHDVEFNAISGSAIGLITIGVMQGKPKCTAVQAWIQTLWTEYYVRKAGGSTNYDFSACDNCPHTVPELMQELGL